MLCFNGLLDLFFLPICESNSELVDEGTIQVALIHIYIDGSMVLVESLLKGLCRRRVALPVGEERRVDGAEPVRLRCLIFCQNSN